MKREENGEVSGDEAIVFWSVVRQTSLAWKHQKGDVRQWTLCMDRNYDGGHSVTAATPSKVLEWEWGGNPKGHWACSWGYTKNKKKQHGSKPVLSGTCSAFFPPPWGLHHHLWLLAPPFLLWLLQARILALSSALSHSWELAALGPKLEKRLRSIL